MEHGAASSLLFRSVPSDWRDNHAQKRAAELSAEQAACDAAGDGEDCFEPVCEHNRFWNAGVEAFDGGVPISDCPYQEKSVEQDDWLRGWLTAEAQLDPNQGAIA